MEVTVVIRVARPKAGPLEATAKFPLKQTGSCAFRVLFFSSVLKLDGATIHRGESSFASSPEIYEYLDDVEDRLPTGERMAYWSEVQNGDTLTVDYNSDSDDVKALFTLILGDTDAGITYVHDHPRSIRATRIVAFDTTLRTQSKLVAATYRRVRVARGPNDPKARNLVVEVLGPPPLGNAAAGLAAAKLDLYVLWSDKQLRVMTPRVQVLDELKAADPTLVKAVAYEPKTLRRVAWTIPDPGASSTEPTIFVTVAPISAGVPMPVRLFLFSHPSSPEAEFEFPANALFLTG